jgi:hypothetical protein
MSVCLRLASVATLLIGLQLFSPKMVEAKVETNLSNNVPANQLLAVANSRVLQGLDETAQAKRKFEPPDNGGPDNTQGSGTR